MIRICRDDHIGIQVNLTINIPGTLYDKVIAFSSKNDLLTSVEGGNLKIDLHPED